MCEWSKLALTEIMAEVVGERVRGEESEEPVERDSMMVELGILYRKLLCPDR